MAILTKDKYVFCPAASFYQKHGGLGIYVRYKGVPTDRVVVKEYKPTYIWLDCPDREVLIVSDNNRTNSFVPMGCNYDEFFDLNYFDEFGNDDVSLMMFNYLQHEKLNVPKIRRNGRPPVVEGQHQHRIDYIADSGGFQLMTGKVEFVDPRGLAKWYSDNVDWGMVLDIPITDSEISIASIKRAAKVQKRNTEIIKEHLTQPVELINIVHGFSAEQRNAYRDIVHDPSITRMALGGMYYNNIVYSTNQLYQMMQDGSHYKHIHILGVYNIAQMAILVRLANSKNNNVLISSDASTALQSARSKIYHNQQTQRAPSRRMSIGDIDRVPSAYNFTSCHCKVCRSVKYIDILGSIDGANSTFVLAYHNMMEILRFSRQMNYICATSSNLEYKEFIKAILKGHRNGIHTLQALDFIDFADEYGLAAAQQRYQHYINISSISTPQTYPTLFGGKQTDEEETPVEGDDNELNHIVEKYEVFHKEMGSQKRVRKIKDRTKDKGGSGRAAGGVRGSGLKGQIKRKRKGEPK